MHMDPSCKQLRVPWVQEVCLLHVTTLTIPGVLLRTKRINLDVSNSSQFHDSFTTQIHIQSSIDSLVLQIFKRMHTINWSSLNDDFGSFKALHNFYKKGVDTNIEP